MDDNNIRNREFLGQGLAFPLQVNQRGEIALARGEQDIDQSIRIILETIPGERVMRPEFGCRVHELIFAARDDSTRGMLISYVREALDRWEPRIELRGIEVNDDPNNDGAWQVEIKYTVRDTHNERSIVYPFYIMGEE
ncbi:MAG: GPW/gp25 family protein [Ardenticatenales bacterium]|nr:GPW/gp25 family protein [Ardenticatenales bacterium]